ncbi:unnamed protein product [Phytomonas sp. Hart1]|nr:unnamed protein product [Phytomonas sp. Hart1]|eukprot:CCW66056.1 unnamed protein product [Phytomonas sp. isolate Hart1]
MTTYCERPIIFPLSNPTSKAEVTPDEAYRWTNGKAIIASGSPFPETVINGKTLRPSQGNNFYVFPGIGLGCALSRPRYIPDALLIAGALSLYHLTTNEQLQDGYLYPPLTDIRDISAQIAADVILEAQKLKIDGAKDFPSKRSEILLKVKKIQWSPTYSGEIPIN